MTFSRLLTLPAEIRAIVFEHVVRSDKTVVTFKLDEWQQDSYSQATQPSLTRVSRQVRSESLPLWYESNNFVMHTEAPKLDEAKHWLQCNKEHLNCLRGISLWIRYTPFTNDRTSSQGVINVSLVKPKKHGQWKVDPRWNWVTVVRRPAELDGDAKFLVEKLQDGNLISEISREDATPQDYHGLMMDLRLYYIQEKMS